MTVVPTKECDYRWRSFDGDIAATCYFVLSARWIVLWGTQERLGTDFSIQCKRDQRCAIPSRRRLSVTVTLCFHTIFTVINCTNFLPGRWEPDTTNSNQPKTLLNRMAYRYHRANRDAAQLSVKSPFVGRGIEFLKDGLRILQDKAWRLYPFLFAIPGVRRLRLPWRFYKS